jgi:hypothetical protein
MNDPKHKRSLWKLSVVCICLVCLINSKTVRFKEKLLSFFSTTLVGDVLQSGRYLPSYTQDMCGNICRSSCKVAVKIALSK